MCPLTPSLDVCTGANDNMLSVGMPLINTEMHEALLLANVPEDNARAAAAEVAKAQGFASKSDVSGLGVQLRSKIEEHSAEGFSEVNRHSVEFQAEADRGYAEAEKDHAEMDKGYAQLKRSLTVLKFAVISYETIIIALLVKLVFFS